MIKHFYQTIFHPLLHAAGANVYILAVSWTMMNLGNNFPSNIGVFGPAIFLALFVFSAAVMGILFFFKPILLY